MLFVAVCDVAFLSQFGNFAKIAVGWLRWCAVVGLAVAASAGGSWLVCCIASVGVVVCLAALALGDGADGGGEGDAGAEEAVCVKSGVLLKAGKAKFNLRYFELLGSGMLNYKKKETDTELTGSIELSATVRHFLARSFTFLAVLSYFCTHRSEHSCIVSPLENVCGERFRALDLT